MHLPGGTTFVVIEEQQLAAIQRTLDQILSELASLKALGSPATDTPSAGPKAAFVTAREFMDAVRIRRTRFYQLMGTNKIKTIKKGRRIYVLATEIDRYFMDPNI